MKIRLPPTPNPSSNTALINTIPISIQYKIEKEMMSSSSVMPEIRIRNSNFFECSKCFFGNSSLKITNQIFIFIDEIKKEFNIEFSNQKRIEFDYFDISNLILIENANKFEICLKFELYRFPRYSIHLIEDSSEWKNISFDSFSNQINNLNDEYINCSESKIIEIFLSKNQLIFLVNKLKQFYSKFKILKN